MLSGPSRLSLSKSTKSKEHYLQFMAKVVYLANESSNQCLSDFDDFEYAQLRISTASAMRKFYHTLRRVIQYTK